MTQQLQTTIEAAWDNRASLSPSTAPKETIDAVEHVINETGNLPRTSLNIKKDQIRKRKKNLLKNQKKIRIFNKI